MSKLFFAEQVHSFIVSVAIKLKDSKHSLTVAKLREKSNIQTRKG